jgi:DNA-binding transcriptional LysR family regulator
MDFDGIAIFVKVVQAGSFSQAARILRIPNSTVSAKVSALEKKLGVTLLQRTTRKLRVTQAGEAYFGRCVQALEHLQAAENEIATAKRNPQGLLRITASVAVGHSLLPALIPSFLKEYPEIEIELLINNRVLNLVAEGVDLAIRTGKLEDSGLIARKFVPGHFALWATPSYLQKYSTPARPEELSKHECLTSSRSRGKPLELSNGKETATIPVFGRVAADDLETVKRFTVLGQGIGLLPNLICEEEVRQGKIVNVLPQWRGRSAALYFVYPAQRFVSPKVHAFISVAEQIVRGKKFAITQLSFPDRSGAQAVG